MKKKKKKSFKYRLQSRTCPKFSIIKFITFVLLIAKWKDFFFSLKKKKNLLLKRFTYIFFETYVNDIFDKKLNVKKIKHYYFN